MLNIAPPPSSNARSRSAGSASKRRPAPATADAPAPISVSVTRAPSRGCSSAKWRDAGIVCPAASRSDALAVSDDSVGRFV